MYTVFSKTKGGFSNETTHSVPNLRRYREPAYPNAADRRYFVEKAVNIITAILSGIGFVSAMVFLATMG